MTQRPRPEAYLGFDPHRGMVQWCRTHLTAAIRSSRFAHLDIRCPFNPEGVEEVLPFPVEDPETLIIACSVSPLFAHQTEHYLRETAAALAPGGRAVTTWLLFDKRYFPFMQESQNELFQLDPWNAVVSRSGWLLQTLAANGLALAGVGCARDPRPPVDVGARARVEGFPVATLPRRGHRAVWVSGAPGPSRCPKSPGIGRSVNEPRLRRQRGVGTSPSLRNARPDTRAGQWTGLRNRWTAPSAILRPCRTPSSTAFLKWMPM